MMDETLQERPIAPTPSLTGREKQILGLLVEELSNGEIAAELTVALSTVKWYLRQIYGKLGAGSREEAVARARALELVPDIRRSRMPANNLRAQATALVGREEEVTALDELIRGAKARLVTILGPGGIGKTRLAQAVAEHELAQRERVKRGAWLPRFADGVWFMPLAPVKSPAHLIPVIADTLAFPLKEEERRAPEEQLGDYLRGKQMLLVLDNFEQLLEGGEVLSRLLEAAPELQILVTSRERLRLHGEHLFFLEGLAIPVVDMGSSAVLESPAVQLFLQTAHRLQPKLALAEADVMHLGRICRLVAGMPLALELAASWVIVLPLNEIADEIERNLEFLQTNLRDVPERHQSMLAALTTSWKRLGASEKELFPKLCIFQGGFRRDAAREVAGATLPLLVTLANASWLRYEREQNRYQIHELLRQFGEGRLRDEVDREREVLDRHMAYFCAFLAQQEGDWHGPRQQEVFREVRDEADNVRAAWTWAVERGQVDWLARALDSFCRYYEWHGDLDEAKGALRAACASLEPLVNNAPIDVAAGRLLIRLRAWQSRLGHRSGDTFEVRRALLNEAEAVLDALIKDGEDVRREEAILARQVGETEASVDPKRSRRHFERSIALYRELDDFASAAVVQGWLGRTEWFLGRYEEAAAFLQQSLTTHRAVGNRRRVAGTLKILGLVYKHKGYLVEAERMHRESYAQFKELGDQTEEWDLVLQL